MDTSVLIALVLAAVSVVGVATVATMFSIHTAEFSNHVTSTSISTTELKTSTIIPTEQDLSVAGVVFSKGPELQLRHQIDDLTRRWEGVMPSSLTPSSLLASNTEGIISNTTLESWLTVSDPHLVAQVDASSRVSLSLNTTQVKETLFAEKNTALNPVVLDASGKVDAGLFPLVALTSVSVGTNNIRLANGASYQEGDVFVTNDTFTTYLRNSNTYDSNNAEQAWVEVQSKHVSALNGANGVVTLNKFSALPNDTVSTAYNLEVATDSTPSKTSLGITVDNLAQSSQLLHNVSSQGFSQHGGPGVKVVLAGGGTTSSKFQVTTYTADTEEVGSALTVAGLLEMNHHGNVGVGAAAATEASGPKLKVTGHTELTGTLALLTDNAYTAQALDISPTISTDTDKGTANVIGLNLQPTINTQAPITTASFCGLLAKPGLGGTGTTQNAYGIKIEELTKASGTVNTAYGLHVTAPTAGAINHAAYITGATKLSQSNNTAGMRIDTTADFGGTTGGSFAGLTIAPQDAQGSGTLEAMYGLQIKGFNMAGGTVTNAYGLHVTAPRAGTNNYTAYFTGSVTMAASANTESVLIDATADLGTTTGASFAGLTIAPANVEATSGTLTDMYGLQIKAFDKDAGTVTNAYGLHVVEPNAGTNNYTAYFTGSAKMAASANAGGVLIGASADTGVDASNSFAGLTIAPANVNGDGTLTDMYGLQIKPFGKISGAVTNAYGLHVTTPTAGSSNYAAFFSGSIQVTGITLISNGTNTEGVSIDATANTSDVAGNSFAGLTIAPTNVQGTTGTLTDMYGLQVKAFDKDGGTITNAYGLQVTTPQAGTNNYAAYFTGSTTMAASATAHGVMINTTANVGETTGGRFSGLTIAPADVQGDGTLTDMYGLHIHAFDQNGGTVTNAYGLHVTAPAAGSTNIAAWFSGKLQMTGTTALLTSVNTEGVLIDATAELDGTTGGSFAGLTIAPTNVQATSGTLTDMYGLQIKPFDTISGTVTNAYSLHVTTPTAGSSNYAALFSGRIHVAGTTTLISNSVNTEGVLIDATADFDGSTGGSFAGLTIADTVQGAGTLDTIYGLQIKAVGKTGDAINWNAYGLHVTSPGVGVTDNKAAVLVGDVLVTAQNDNTNDKRLVQFDLTSAGNPGVNNWYTGVDVTRKGYGCRWSGGQTPGGTAAAVCKLERIDAYGVTTPLLQFNEQNRALIGDMSISGTRTFSAEATDAEGVLLDFTVDIAGYTSGSFAGLTIAPGPVQSTPGTGVLPKLYGLQIKALPTTAVTVTNAYGLHVTAPAAGTTKHAAVFTGAMAVAQSANAEGLLIDTSASFGASITSGNYTSVTIAPQPVQGTSGGTLTNMYGLQIKAIGKTGGGTVINAYGLHVATPTAGQNNYAAYFDGAIEATTINTAVVCAYLQLSRDYTIGGIDVIQPVIEPLVISNTYYISSDLTKTASSQNGDDTTVVSRSGYYSLRYRIADATFSGASQPDVSLAIFMVDNGGGTYEIDVGYYDKVTFTHGASGVTYTMEVGAIYIPAGNGIRFELQSTSNWTITTGTSSTLSVTGDFTMIRRF